MIGLEKQCTASPEADCTDQCQPKRERPGRSAHRKMGFVRDPKGQKPKDCAADQPVRTSRYLDHLDSHPVVPGRFPDYLYISILFAKCKYKLLLHCFLQYQKEPLTTDRGFLYGCTFKLYTIGLNDLRRGPCCIYPTALRQHCATHQHNG